MKRAFLLGCLAWAFTAPAQIPSYVPTDGLVAWYPFNGNVNDEFASLNGSGSPSAFTTGVSGIPLSAAFFTGNQIVDLPSSFDFAERSFSAWIKPASWSWQLIFSVDHPGLNHGMSNIGLGHPDNPTSIGLQLGGPSDRAPWFLDEWIHVAACRNQDSTWFYFNGNLSSSTTSNNLESVAGTSNARFGSDRFGGRQFNGTLDDVTIHNRVLTSEEVTALFNMEPVATGCTDEQACNYDSEANVDDGSCIPSGCMEEGACNYNADAGCDDSSCLYPPMVELGSNTTLCEGESLELSVQSPGLTTTWNTGATGGNITVTETGTYSVETGSSISTSSPTSIAIEFGPPNPGLVAPASPGMNVQDGGEVTLASWVYASDQIGSQRIIALTDEGSVYQQYAMSIEGQGRLYFLSGASEFEANGANLSFSTVPIDEWAHVAVTVQSDGVRMYINGVLDRFNPVQDQFPTNWASHFGIAKRADGAEQFQGKLSQIAVWSRALDDAEIQDLFTCPVDPASIALEALWLSETSPVGTVTDESGNGNDAAYSGTSESGPTQSCSTTCSASDSITINFMDCADLCGPGTVWDPELQSCVAETPSLEATENCTLFTLQDLAEGYQILLAENAELDSLLADCNGTSTSDQSGPCSGEDVVTYHGYDYDIVEIGDQCWFAENLRTSSFQDGSAIPFIGSADDWYVSIPRYCHWQNNSSHAEVHGNLYNWFTATDSRGLCPSSWHVPSDEEWASMEAFIGIPVNELQQTGWRGTSEGALLKSTADGGTNDFGFNGLISGYRCATSGFCSVDHSGFWTSSEKDSQDGWARWLGQNENRIMRYQDDWKHNGNSVRCVKD